MKKEDVLKTPLAAVLDGVEEKAKNFIVESPLHLEGVLNRLYRLDAFLRHTLTLVPKFDNDGHPVPLRAAIEQELQLLPIPVKIEHEEKTR